MAMFRLRLEAKQQDNPLRAASAEIDIGVVDVNDNVPAFGDDSAYNVTLGNLENLPEDYEVMRLHARDGDQVISNLIHSVMRRVNCTVSNVTTPW